MPAGFRFTCALANGLHARPASMIAEVVKRFSAEVTIAKESGAGPVNAASVLSIVGLDIKHGDACLVAATGAEADAAVLALREFIEDGLAAGDELPPAETTSPCGPPLPAWLRRQTIEHAAGRPASSGVGDGIAVFVGGLALPAEVRTAAPGPVADELDAARRAMAAVRADLRRRADAGAGIAGELLRAHSQIADDPALLAAVEGEIRAGRTAPQAVVAAGERFGESLRAAASAYIRERAADIQDVCTQIADRLLGGKLAAMHVKLDQDSVVFADALTPSQLMKLEPRHVRGLVLGYVGRTSHVVILARSFRIPTLIEVPGVARVVRPGERAFVDGDGGFVVTKVTPGVIRYYERERRARERFLTRMAPLVGQPAVTTDGVALEIGVNASTPEEVVAGVAGGADGVGLLRTEMLFLDRDFAPSEQEQFEAYSAVVAAAGGRPVIIRTFDIGGDKPAPYLAMAPEENPFLGVRGLRLYEKHPALLRDQLRAIVRASALGPVRVMAPMVSTPPEAAWFRERVNAIQSELADEGVNLDRSMHVGIMVEVPSVALVMDQLAEHVDFFSIGTNDLCQYWMAVDRGNAGCGSLYSGRQPSFLRLLRVIVEGARSRGKWIGVCGEMGGDRLNLPLMIGLGLDEISMAPSEVMRLKSAVRGMSSRSCRELLAHAERCRTVAEVESLLKGGAAGPGQPGAPTATDGAPTPDPVLSADLIDPDCDALTKEEAIKSAVDLLLIAGRTERPREVEEAVWAREETYSTGLGYGFAVPHCKTDAVRSPALAVVKMRTPVEWGSEDGVPVKVALLLAVPAADAAGAHMRVFARLARKLMHEGFRERLAGADDRESIETFLASELEL